MEKGQRGEGRRGRVMVHEREKWKVYPGKKKDRVT